MRDPIPPSSRRTTRQPGMAMIALITLLALLSAYLISTLLSRTSSEVLVDRSQRTQDALLKAKAALIAFAADTTSTAIQPGALPCPDTNDDGTAEGSCSGTNVVLGRLPWKTLGVDDIRDASGERLWYALSPRFRKMSSTVVNSDTRGQLTITDGTASSGNIVAVVIAPGPALGAQSQSRTTANANTAAHYLEGTNAGTTGTLTYATATTAQPSDTFNDRIIAITEADLFAMVEPVVASMIERDLKPDLATYYTQWSNRFPFPSRFDNPDPGSNSYVSPPVTTRTQAQYIGDITQTPGGLLPVTASVTYPWTGGSGVVTLTGGTAGGISGVWCSAISWPLDAWNCSFDIDAINLGGNKANWGPCNGNRYCMIAPSFTVSGAIGANAGKSFPKLPNASEVTVTSSGGGSTRNLTARAISGTLSAAGVGTVTFSGTYSGNGANDPPRYSSSSFSRTMRVRIPDILVSPLTSSTSWFIANEWYRLTYYAVSPGHLPDGSGTCTALPGTPSCLTVNKMPSYYASPGTDKRAVLILGGRSLNATSRPSATLGNYLESTNAAPAGYIFEHRAGLPSSINDRVVVVCPDSALCP